MYTYIYIYTKRTGMGNIDSRNRKIIITIVEFLHWTQMITKIPAAPPLSFSIYIYIET